MCTTAPSPTSTPFIDNLTGNVSAHVGIANLGWVTRSDAIHRANCNRIPALLMPHETKKKADRVKKELEDLRAMAIGLEPPKKKRSAHSAAIIEPEDHLAFTMKTRRPSEFGDTRIYTPREMLATLFAKTWSAAAMPPL